MSMILIYYICTVNGIILSDMCKAFVSIVLFCAVITSCVDQDFDLSKIKKDSVELTREVTVEVNETTDSTIGSLLGLDESVVTTDTEGNLIVPVENSKHVQTTVSKEDIESGAKMTIEGNFCLKLSDVPDIIRRSTNSAAPFFIVVDNPTGNDVDMFGEISNADGKTWFGPVVLRPGVNRIDMRNCAEAVPYLKNISKDVTVSSFSICGNTATKLAVAASAATQVEYTFDLSAYVPLQLDPGFETQVSISLDELNVADVKDYLSDNQLDATSFTINATIVSEVPLAIAATLECSYKDGSKGTVTISPEVAAGTLGQPATSEIVLKSNLPSGLADVDSAVVIIKGRVPSEKFTDPVSLNEKQSFRITLNDIEVTIGANYEL